MKKTIAILAALLLAFAPVMSYAATATLSDSEMDQVAAGDWVILTDSAGNQTVADVYHTNNTLDLSDEAQMELQAVSNANTVDSAIAVQTNITSVTGQEPSPNVAINQSNAADITNYAPANSEATSSSAFIKKSESGAFVKADSSKFGLTATESSSKEFKLTETLDIEETLDILYAAASAEETECKNCETEKVSAEVLIVDYDYTLDYDKNIEKSEKHEARLDISKEEKSFKAAKFEKDFIAKKEESKSTRYNHGRNNHIDLEDTSQKNLQAVSNLNSVASGAAIQTNITSNVGVGGTITQSNLATVVSGL